MIFKPKKQFLLIVAILSLAIYSCSDNKITEELGAIQQANTENEEIAIPEMHNPYARGVKKEIRGNNFRFSYEEIDGLNIREGDIIISDEQLQEIQEFADNPSRGAYISTTSKRWKNNIVPFVITDLTLTARAVAAMNHISSNTNIVFQLRNPISHRHKNYIKFVVGAGCSSYVGMQGGGQNITLAPGCGVGATIHEICHALGMEHEHNRNDRNNFVIIHNNNIQDDYEYAFEQDNCTVDHGPFDFGSIMMYRPCSFADVCFPQQICDCLAADASITDLNGNLYDFQRDSLSSGDIAAINTMYPFHPCTNVPCCMVQCLPGYICINGVCVIDTNNPPSCINNSDCPPGYVCLGQGCTPM